MKKTIALGLVFSLTLAGCAQHHGAIIIHTQPEGAEIVDVKSGVVMGVTPLKYWWMDNSITRKFVNIRVQKEGYRDKTNSFWVDLRHQDRQAAIDNAQPIQIILDSQ